MEEKSRIKTFWERPEGTTGMIVGICILGILGYFGWIMLPFIITLLQNTITAAVLCAVAAALLYVLFFDNRLKTLGIYTYKSLMRFITGLIIEIDPIGILKNYVETLKTRLCIISEKIGELSSQMRILKNQIVNNNNEINKYMELANYTKKHNGDVNIITLNSRAAARLQTSNEKLNNLYLKIEGFHTILKRMYAACDLMIKDMENDIKVKSQERIAVQKSWSAMQNAIKIINGDRDGRDLYDQTMEYLQDSYGEKIGEIEHFMDMSSNFMNTVDIENGLFDEKALHMLENWEKNTFLELPQIEFEPEHV